MFIKNVSNHVIHAVSLTAKCRTFVFCESWAGDPAAHAAGLGGLSSSRFSSSSADIPVSPPALPHSCKVSASTARFLIRTTSYPSTTFWRFRSVRLAHHLYMKNRDVATALKTASEVHKNFAIAVVLARQPSGLSVPGPYNIAKFRNEARSYNIARFVESWNMGVELL